MATRRKSRAAKSRRRTTKRRSPITRLRRHAVYATNPRRKRRVRRRGYRRNPAFGRGILGDVVSLVKQSGSALIGAAVGRTVTGMIPIGDATNPIVNFAKGTLVAIGIRTFGARVIGKEAASFAAVGAMLGPTKDLIVSFVPQAGQFLGEGSDVMYLPSIPAGRMAAYSGEVTGADVMDDTGSGMGSYSGDMFAV